jgi:hypothetical protein
MNNTSAVDVSIQAVSPESSVSAAAIAGADSKHNIDISLNFRLSKIFISSLPGMTTPALKARNPRSFLIDVWIN